MHFSRALILILCLVACQVSCQAAKWGSRQNPVSLPSGDEGLPEPYLQTLESIMPRGTRVIRHGEARVKGTPYYEIEAGTPFGIMTVWLDLEGFPLKIIEELAPEDIPPRVLEHAPNVASVTPFERHWIMLYEVEIKAEGGGEIELFVDGSGREHFRIVENEDDDESGDDEEESRRASSEELPAEILDRLDRYLQGAFPIHIEKEREWGRSLFEVEWKDGGETRELKLFFSGEVLLQELPASHRIPPRVRAMAQHEAPEGILLAVYCLKGLLEGGCWLADGASFPISR